MNNELVRDPRVTEGDKIAVWFSCGAASAVAAYQIIELYKGFAEIFVVNNPVEEEDQDNRRFLKDVGDWLGYPILEARSSKYPDARCVDVWEKRQFMSGPRGAPCTLELKKGARQEWEAIHKPDWHVLGFTFEEKGRSDRFRLTERDNLLTPLIDTETTKEDCFKEVNRAGLKLPIIYELGYPNANCIGCVKATSPTYWNHVRKQHPKVFAERAEQSERIGARLVRVKGKRIFLTELDPKAKGHPMKNMTIECGIFCEEKEI